MIDEELDRLRLLAGNADKVRRIFPADPVIAAFVLRELASGALVRDVRAASDADAIRELLISWVSTHETAFPYHTLTMVDEEWRQAADAAMFVASQPADVLTRAQEIVCGTDVAEPDPAVVDLVDELARCDAAAFAERVRNLAPLEATQADDHEGSKWIFRYCGRLGPIVVHASYQKFDWSSGIGTPHLSTALAGVAGTGSIMTWTQRGGGDERAVELAERFVGVWYKIGAGDFSTRLTAVDEAIVGGANVKDLVPIISDEEWRQLPAGVPDDATLQQRAAALTGHRVTWRRFRDNRLVAFVHRLGRPVALDAEGVVTSLDREQAPDLECGRDHRIGLSQFLKADALWDEFVVTERIPAGMYLSAEQLARVALDGLTVVDRCDDGSVLARTEEGELCQIDPCGHERRRIHAVIGGLVVPRTVLGYVEHADDDDHGCDDDDRCW